jgi:hypothetical protein
MSVRAVPRGIIDPRTDEMTTVQAARTSGELAISLPSFTDDLVVMLWSLPESD